MNELVYDVTVRPDALFPVSILMNRAAAAAFYNFAEFASRPSMDWQALWVNGEERYLRPDPVETGEELVDHADFVHRLVTTPGLVEVAEEYWRAEEDDVLLDTDVATLNHAEPDNDVMVRFAPSGYMWCPRCGIYEATERVY